VGCDHWIRLDLRICRTRRGVCRRVGERPAGGIISMTSRAQQTWKGDTSMAHDRAGRTARASDLDDIAHLVTAYYSRVPDPADPAQKVVFSTSGHRGSSLDAAFNERHILAITQAIVEYRATRGITGPVYLARDTHALSEPAWTTALEVLAGNGVTAMIDAQSEEHTSELQSREKLVCRRLLAKP